MGIVVISVMRVVSGSAVVRLVMPMDALRLMMILVRSGVMESEALKALKIGTKYRVKEAFVLDLETDEGDIIFDGFEVKEGDVFTLDEVVTGYAMPFTARIIMSCEGKWVRITEETFYRYFESLA